MTARSSERRTCGGTGPGPGRSGVRSGAGGTTRRRGLTAAAPRAAARRPAPPSSSTSAAARERRRHLLLLLDGREARREARVDGLELIGVRRVEVAPAGRRARSPAASACPAARSGCASCRRGAGTRAPRSACRARPCRSRILALLACWAMSIGSAPRVLAPSESSTIAVGSLRVPPSPSGIGVCAALAARARGRRPSRCRRPRRARRSASSSCVRSVVGATTCSAREPNLISPSRKSSGTWRVSVRAASRAAVRRSGRTSLASIEPDVSVTMHHGRLLALGRRPCARAGRSRPAAPRARAAPAAPGRWRSQLAVATEASTSTFV